MVFAYVLRSCLLCANWGNTGGGQSPGREGVGILLNFVNDSASLILVLKMFINAFCKIDRGPPPAVLLRVDPPTQRFPAQIPSRIRPRSLSGPFGIFDPTLPLDCETTIAFRHPSHFSLLKFFRNIDNIGENVWNRRYGLQKSKKSVSLTCSFHDGCSSQVICF